MAHRGKHIRSEGNRNVKQKPSTVSVTLEDAGHLSLDVCALLCTNWEEFKFDSCTQVPGMQA